MSAEGYAWPARVAVYTGDRLENLSPVAEKASPAHQQPAQVFFDALAGTTYSIAVDSIGGPTLLKLILSAPPSNDNFASATDEGSVSFTVAQSTFGASREPGENGGGASAWYRWTAPTTRGYAVKLRMPSAFYFPPIPPNDPRFEPTYGGIRYPVATVYRGDALTNLVSVGIGGNLEGFEADLSFVGVTGVSYYLSVDEASGFMSNFTLSLQAGPANDNFTDAAPLNPGQALKFTTLGATREPREPRNGGLTGEASLWWRWTAPTNSTVAFTIWIDGSLPIAAVYTGSALANLVPFGVIAPPTFSRPVTIRAIAGTTYWFAVDQIGGAPSMGTVELTTVARNDDFENRQTLRTSQTAAQYGLGSTYGATHEFGEPDHGNGTNSASIWWTWTAPSNGLYALHLSAPAHTVRTYTGAALTNLQIVTSKQVALAQGSSRTEIEAAAGTAYQIAVDIAAGGGYGFGLSIFPVPPNDHFTNRLVLAGASNMVHASAMNASREFGELGSGLPGSVWWSWTVPESGLASVLITNTDVHVNVFTNQILPLPTGVTNLGRIFPRTIDSGRRSDFAVTSNVTYYVAAYSTAMRNPTVDFTLLFRTVPPLVGNWHSFSLRFTTSTLNPWFSQTNTVFDPPDAVESGYAQNGASSVLYAQVAGPGELSFWWKVSASESNRNLYFTYDEGLWDTLIGPRDWTRHARLIGPGTNTISWTLDLRGGTAWVDRVEFIPGQPGAAVLTMNPVTPWGYAVLRINGETGRPYQIQASTNLTDWFMWTNVIGNGAWPYVDLPVATNSPAWFFRAVTE